MNNAELQMLALGDPRLAVHATSTLAAWLWSSDGTRVLWANPVGARLFGTANSTALAGKIFGPADPHRRQIARLAGRLLANGAVRLERLQGFGAAPGMLATCGCSRLDLPDGSHGILVAAGNISGRAMPLKERLQRLVEGLAMPVAAFTRDGILIGTSDTARPLLGFHNLVEAGLDDARQDALKQGAVATAIDIGRMVVQRVGAGADIGLVALIVPDAVHAAAPEPVAAAQPQEEQPQEELPEPLEPPVAGVVANDPAPVPPQPAPMGEAPAALALFDALAEAPEQEPETEPVAAAAPSSSKPSAALPPEPSPDVEAIAAEATPSFAADAAPESSAENLIAPIAAVPVEAPSWFEEPSPHARRLPLRFMWQMDQEGRFTLGADEFTRLIGPHTTAGFGRLWSEIAEAFGLDPEGRVMKAFATRQTWSGITLNWPVDGGARLPVELSGLPIFDRARHFAGFRGFGVCRDLDGLARLAALRRYEFFGGAPAPIAPEPHSADIVQAGPASDSVGPELPAQDPSAEDAPQEALPQENFSENVTAQPTAADDPPAEFVIETSVASPPVTELPEPIASEISHPTDLDAAVEPPKDTLAEMQAETPKNVLPFRPPGDAKPPSLTPVENSAFNELARQLSARLENENGNETAQAVTGLDETVVENTASTDAYAAASQEAASDAPVQPEWLAPSEPPARGESRRDKALLDLLPVGILIYRLDRLLYANPAFLTQMGYPSLHALEDAGGLDALYVEPGVSNAPSTSDTGTPVMISASQPKPAEQGSEEDPEGPASTPPAATDARLYTISWDGDSALALIFSGARSEAAAVAAAIAEALPVAEPPAAEPLPAGHADAEELGAILDTTAEGIVMFDAEGNISSANRSAEALFGYDGEDLARRNLADLFAPESQHEVFDYLASIKSEGVASLLEHGRETLGRESKGGFIPLSMTMGRTKADGPNFFAVFRDLSQAKQSENELREARRLAERAASAKADVLARISHEVRTPLNAIIGFSEVMIGERFGALGNERYVEYMKDIRASGERVISIINDLLDLSRIETGKLDLSFTNQNLNELVESCVAVMQPQANRERIIIRTSLAHTLPPVVADARALRQITLNLIGNSIHLANAGGQVIVSTALSDFGEVMLRVRDTGHGLNDNEVAAALEPFRTPAPSDQASEGAGVSLSLTKALVEANRARFQIKTGARSGTLIEVVFAHTTAKA
ncbi:PAS domain S-box protein [Bradyrhizobium sp. AUGA SZCCT0176]|uniref:PAS domain-containing protein n=1 Tax=Bradyrhizobium sp. AUGA SZCCT0176 TaxID=2807664 RepID=UPI001BA93C09|nr:PAS domain-containing protein [Bradyrhizobium sp. AUGA SZCCT0176]MBR1225310.1 PAS domain S-box protein [Bradyrhizobium sp. AUGA SZCCT0176]